MSKLEFEQVFNLAEAGLWITISVIMMVKEFRVKGAMETLPAVASAALFLFGVSDLVEARTGYWWKPVWLLVFKVLCVLTLLTCLVSHLKSKKHATEHDTQKDNKYFGS